MIIILYKILRKIIIFFGVPLHFSSDGEDYILQKIFSNLKNGYYIDIGSHHPILHSNTFLFYLNGWRGVCVDPYTDDFLKGILWVLNNNNSKLKSNCRQHVIDNFASKKIALKHIKLYKKIIKG